MLQVKQVSFPPKNFGIRAASSLQDALLLLNQQCRATFSSNNGTFLLFADHTQPFASSSTARMLVDYCSALCFVSWCTLNSCGGDLRSTLLVVIVRQPFKTETWNWVWFFIHFFSSCDCRLKNGSKVTSATVLVCTVRTSRLCQLVTIYVSSGLVSVVLVISCNVRGVLAEKSENHIFLSTC